MADGIQQRFNQLRPLSAKYKISTEKSCMKLTSSCCYFKKEKHFHTKKENVVIVNRFNINWAKDKFSVVCQKYFQGKKKTLRSFLDLCLFLVEKESCVC